MTTIYLIRHAEAEGNLYRRAQGQYDSNLTALGREQTAALAERFRSVHIDALWASDLIRTQSTASAILKYHPDLALHTDPALREVDVGCWENRSWADIARQYPAQHRLFTQDPARWSVPGGEDYEALVRRMTGAVTGLARAYPGKTLAVVSHAFVIRALLARVMGVPHAQLVYGGNTAVSLLHVQGEDISVEYYNDASHLGPLSRAEQSRRWEDGRITPLAMPREREVYEQCYRRTWLASHGDLNGYTPQLYVRAAAKAARTDSRLLVKIQRPDGSLAGLLQLDPDRDRDKAAGWVSLIYVDPQARHKRYGAQLIGYAVSYFRSLGRRYLRLHVSQSNETAQAFYEAMGFGVHGTTEGVGGPLYLMQAAIERKVWVLP